MAAQNQSGVIRRVPIVTLSMVAAAAIVFLIPALHPALVYDRSAILRGELWRLATGAWVHFSARHFLYDTATLGLAGWMIERGGYRHFSWVCVLTPLVSGIASLALEPGLEICGGLSGVATAAVVFLAVHGVEEAGAWRWICWFVLVATAAKIWTELTTRRFVFLEMADAGFVLVPSNHVVGGMTALAAYVWGKVLPPKY